MDIKKLFIVIRRYYEISGGIVITFSCIDVVTGNHCYKARVVSHSALIEIMNHSNCPQIQYGANMAEELITKPGILEVERGKLELAIAGENAAEVR